MKNNKLNKRIKILALILMIILISFNFYDILNGVISMIDGDVVSELGGKIFYLKRDKEILNLYSSDANLENKKLIYTNTDSLSQNKNIIGFQYDKSRDIIDFVCMNKGDWTLHSIKPNGKYLKVLRSAMETKTSNKVKNMDSYSIKPIYKDLKAISEKGSMYLIKEGEKVLLKKFIGIHDSKFNSGYSPVGFSPNGKYLVFRSSNHLTPIGTLLEGVIKNNPSNNYQIGDYYIMNLETKAIDKYIYAYSIQWVK